jgi:hypothetical protein
MSIRQKIATAAIATVAVVTAGCDPGYTYKPTNDAGQLVEEWTTKIGDVRFSCGPDNLLIGSRSKYLVLTVENASQDGVEILGAQVETGGRSISADLLPDPDNCKERVVPASETKSVWLLVDLGGSASEVLAPSVAHVWRVQIGTAEHVLRAELRRE